jgi:predicted transcriptional regulator
VIPLDKPDLYVLARILDVVYRSGIPLKKTQVQLVVGLNYPRFMEYLDWMEEHGLLSRSVDTEGNETIGLTQKGLESYHRFVDWVRDTITGIKI